MTKNKSAYHLQINGSKYEWNQKNITGLEVKELGKIPAGEELFLKIKGKKEDESIADNTSVDLDTPGLDQFYSEAKEKVTIVVNTRPKPWDEKKITYDQVVKLAFPDYVENAASVYTVTYERGPKQNQEGTMVKGDRVFVKDKMNFVVSMTNRS